MPRVLPGIQPAKYVRPSKLTFDFSRQPDWRSRFNISGARTPPDCGQVWPGELANIPEYQPNPRIPIAEEDGDWLAQARSRIGKCVTFGLSKDKLQLAGNVLETLNNWRRLSFANYGFSVAFDKLVSMNVRVTHPLLDKPNDSLGHFAPYFHVRLINHARIIWLRDASTGIYWRGDGHKTAWKSMGFPNSPYDIHTNEINFSMVDQRGPTGNLTVFHRLRPGFVRPDGTMHNSFDIDSQVVSVAQERVLAKATANLSIVARKGAEEIDGFDVNVALQLLGMMMKQEDLRRKTQKKHAQIEQHLRTLENDSWKREGAVEDLGTAAKA